MKKFISTLVLICFLSILAFAQHEFMKFQGIARDTDGEAMANITVQVKFYIYPDGDDYNDPVKSWSEQQNLDTDGYGVFSASIGVVNDDDYKAINFLAATYKLRVDFIIDGIDVMVSDEVLQSVPYARSADNGVPPGCIMPFAGPVANIPAGWKLCDGTSLSTADYPFLYAAIGNAWGGDVTNFNLPDLRGNFLRGVDGGRGLDPDAADRTPGNTGGNPDEVGSSQDYSIERHAHSAGTYSNTSNGKHKHTASFDAISGEDLTGNHVINNASGSDFTINTSEAPNHTHTINGTSGYSGTDETRPVNVYVNYIIKL